MAAVYALKRSIWIGFDPREAAAFAVTRHSIKERLSSPIPIMGIVLDEMRRMGLYTRPTEKRNGVLWDVLSDAPMSTEFACSRFLTPILARRGWALFMDCDMLVLGDLTELFDEAERSGKALLCVQHQHRVEEGAAKMDGQVQVNYARKAWSSLMMIDCDHPANRRLTVDMVNRLPGRDLHRFCWLPDEDIGAIDPGWNVLVGHTDCDDPKLLHFTDGVPLMPGYENGPYAEEWRINLARWAGWDD